MSLYILHTRFKIKHQSYKKPYKYTYRLLLILLQSEMGLGDIECDYCNHCKNWHSLKSLQCQYECLFSLRSSIQTQLVCLKINQLTLFSASMHKLYKIWGPELTKIRISAIITAKCDKYCPHNKIAKAKCMQQLHCGYLIRRYWWFIEILLNPSLKIVATALYSLYMQDKY